MTGEFKLLCLGCECLHCLPSALLSSYCLQLRSRIRFYLPACAIYAVTWGAWVWIRYIRWLLRFCRLSGLNHGVVFMRGYREPWMKTTNQKAVGYLLIHVEKRVAHQHVKSLNKIAEFLSFWVISRLRAFQGKSFLIGGPFGGGTKVGNYFRSKVAKVCMMYVHDANKNIHAIASYLGSVFTSCLLIIYEAE